MGIPDIGFVVALISGIVCGAAAGFFAAKVKAAAALAKSDTEKELLQSRLAECKNECEEEKRKLKNEMSELKAENEKRRKDELEVQQTKFDETIGKVKAEMIAATEKMLKDRQKDFTEFSGENLGNIVNPLKESIEKMKQVMHESTLRQTQMTTSLQENLKNVMTLSENAKISAEELANVMKNKSKIQGNWGEMVLDNLLQSQGLVSGIHYDVQKNICDADGKIVYNDEKHRLQPDVILHLDSRREVIIDSKVSLTAFINYVNAENDSQRETALKAHIESLEKHVAELAKKNYAGYIQPPKSVIDYVIMFVPHSAALWTALNAKPALWRDAMSKNVYIADEQTLYAALRIIKMTWTQIAQNENYEKVYKFANEMVERVGIFMESYKKIGDSLNKARESYDNGYKKLQPGGQSILTTCQNLLKTGAKQSNNKKYFISEIEDSRLVYMTSEKNEASEKGE